MPSGGEERLRAKGMVASMDKVKGRQRLEHPLRLMG